MKHIERFKKLCKLGVKLEWLEKDPAINYQLHFDKVERDYLTEEELNTLDTSTLEKQTHKIARDIFVFSCYTGLAYCDVFSLTQEHIVLGIDGNKWLMTQREKTAIKVRVLYWTQHWQSLKNTKSIQNASKQVNYFQYIQIKR